MYDQLQGDTATGQYRFEQDGDRCELRLLQEHGCQHTEASGGVRAELATSCGHVGHKSRAESTTCTEFSPHPRSKITPLYAAKL